MEKISEVMELYGEDIRIAQDYLENNQDKISLVTFISNQIRIANRRNHSDIWSDIYDFIENNYPDEDAPITGLTYYVEVMGGKYGN